MNDGDEGVSGCQQMYRWNGIHFLEKNTEEMVLMLEIKQPWEHSATGEKN